MAAGTTNAAFVLDDSQLAELTVRRKRASKPSIYLAEVTNAATTLDKSYGIAFDGSLKVSKIVAELHKAAKTLNVKIRVWDRSGVANPFVGFKVIASEATPTE